MTPHIIQKFGHLSKRAKKNTANGFAMRLAGMPKKTTKSSDKTKRRQQQPTTKRKQETSAIHARTSRESKTTAKNVRRDNPRISLPNPRRIQKHSKVYAFFIGALFIILGAILFLMLFTFTAADLAPDAETALNLFGIIGAYIANIMLTLFGLAAFLFSAVCLLMGIRTLSGKQFEVTPSELIGMLLLILGASPLLQFLMNGSEVLEHAPGGVLGQWLANFGTAHIPTAAFVAICIVLGLFGGLLVTDTKFKTFFLGIWKIIRWTAKTLANAFAEPFRKPLPETVSSVTESPEIPAADNDVSLNESIYYEDSPSELLDDKASDLEERQAMSRQESSMPAEPEISNDSESDSGSQPDLPSEDDAPAVQDDDSLESVSEELDDPDGLHELGNADDIQPEPAEEQEPPKAEKTEALADIMSRIKKTSVPKTRAIKRNHSVPALEPEFEFDSILEPEQLCKSDQTQAKTNTKSPVLANWKPRSIAKKNISPLDLSDCTPAPKNISEPQSAPTVALADAAELNAKKAINIPAPVLPSHMTKDLLAQLATEEIEVDDGKPRPMTAVTRVAPDQKKMQALADALADTDELSTPKKVPQNSNDVQVTKAVQIPQKVSVPLSPNETPTVAPVKQEPQPVKNIKPAEDKTAVPVSAELKALMAEAGFKSPQPQTPASHGAFVVAAEKKRASEDELQEADRVRNEKLRPEPEYQYPPLSLLHYNPATQKGFDNEALRKYADKIEEKLAEYHIQGQVVQICPGPIITRFEFQPAPGTKVSKIANLSDDLMMALEIASIRILAPIPGKGVVGIEIPNEKRDTIFLKEIIGSKQFSESKSILTIALGKDAEGEPVVSDLAKMPHLLVAGSTGSGKSVGINTMICSLLYNASPDEVKFILVDPKCLELSVYEGIPHLLVPPITTPQETAAALDWACEEMDERYRMLSAFGVRNIKGYNEQLKNPTLPKAIELVAEKNEDGSPKYKHMPYIVIVVDEFADLMMTSGKEIERSIARLAQKARAAGIHIILATQRPSTNVITGVIKANFPTRLAFRVFSYVDSRTILDTKGAESLLGMGDSLFLPPNTGILQRVHGAYVSDEEVQSIVSFLAAQRAPEYNLDITTPKDVDNSQDDFSGASNTDLDPLYDQAVQIVAETRQASASFLQRRLSIGFNRAARIIEQMEREGVVGPQKGQKPREVLIQPI